jgi:hypothetical protein
MATRVTCFCRESTGINFSFHRRIGAFRCDSAPPYCVSCTKPQAQTARSVAPRCFRCFSRKLSATGSSFAAEILGFRWLVNRKNSESPHCFRCFPLFLWINALIEISAVRLDGFVAALLGMRAMQDYRHCERREAIAALSVRINYRNNLSQIRKFVN